jgi:hypothetical protein
MKSGEGEPGRLGWGGGGGGGEAYVYRLFEFASSLRKNYKAVTLESFTHIPLGDCNYYHACDAQLSQGLTVDEKSAHLRGTT